MMILFFYAFCIIGIYGYGEPNAGHPDTDERLAIDMINAVRLNPTTYKSISEYSTYNPSLQGVLYPTLFPPAPPLWHAQGLMNSALFHSEDMAEESTGITPETLCFKHDSCSISETAAAGVGENIAWRWPRETSDGLMTNNQLMCDKPKDETECAYDGHSGDGHRDNIMTSSWTEIGIGKYIRYDVDYGDFWTQNFGRCNLEGYNLIEEAIMSGSYFETNEDEIWYTCTFWNNSKSSAKVIIKGQTGESESHCMDRDVIGPDSSQGHYVYRDETASTIDECKSYFFLFENEEDGGRWRYPTTGAFQTYKKGTCESHFTGTEPEVPDTELCPPPPVPQPPPDPDNMAGGRIVLSVCVLFCFFVFFL